MLNLQNRRQPAAGSFPRWLAVVCVIMVLLFAGLEATHNHAASTTGGPCAICISAHANAPVAAVQWLLILLTLGIVAISGDVDGKGVPVDLPLFIRPPPAV